MTEPWPPIEYEEGYPIDEDFTAFTATEPPLNFAKAGAWLLSELPRAAEHMCCACDIRRGKDIMGKPVMRISFSTSGWSGAESIIALINRRIDMRRQMLRWQRGGHYVFEVPVPTRPERLAKPTTPMRTLSERRKLAWETRRAKYGARGHCGAYSR